MTPSEQNELIKKHMEYFREEGEYRDIPPHLLRAYVNWALFGRPAGHFVMATLENDLNKAFSYADSESREALHSIVKLIYNRLPAGCWKTKEKIASWEGRPDWDPKY